MRRVALQVTLRDECIFSARSATLGGHESLDYIPGQALLGVAAGRCYRGGLPRDKAFLAFHSGRLRFGNALPWDGDAQGLPMPFAWHHAKEENPGADGRLIANKVYNFQHTSGITSDAGVEMQPKQMRRGYVFQDGRVVSPDKRFCLKTAIEPGRDRAAEAQLFGYESLTAGQRFLAIIEADDEIDGTLFDDVIEAMMGDVRLGRSRSAEYGRAWIEKVDAVPVLEPGGSPGNKLTLWLLSDLVLTDEHGRPTQEPHSRHFGLGGGEVLWDKTFLRSRRYSPWNAARHGYDRERLVLCAGGVVTMALEETPDEDVLQRLQSGVGLYQEAGLGRIWVNPPLLAGDHPAFEPSSSRPNNSGPAGQVLRPNSLLLDWLEAQSSDWKTDLDERADQDAEACRKLIQAARRMAGVPPHVDFGPSRSQWGRVLETARNHVGQALHDALFEGESAVIKPKGEGWEIEVRDEKGADQTLAGWLKKLFKFNNSQAQSHHYAYRLRQFAHRMRDLTGKKKGGKP